MTDIMGDLAYEYYTLDQKIEALRYGIEWHNEDEMKELMQQQLKLMCDLRKNISLQIEALRGV